MTKCNLFALLAAAGVAVAAVASTSAIAQDKGKNDKQETKASAAVGEAAPAFELKDTDGKSVKLSDYKGKVVVLEWFNPDCPFIVKHHKTNTTFNDLYSQYHSKDVVFLAINSSAAGKQGHGLKHNQEKKAEYKMEYPILLDESGTVGMAYGAKRTPTCYVINKDGVIAYMGAIDNNTDPEKAGDKNYVRLALDEILAGKPVSTTKTDAYGCAVKYAK